LKKLVEYRKDQRPLFEKKIFEITETEIKNKVYNKAFLKHYDKANEWLEEFEKKIQDLGRD
jgi:hypothetical protein